MARILVVDDNSEMVEMLGMVLRANGFDVDTANDGRGVADLVSANQFDLVVTDVIMPDSDGMEVMMELKQHGIPFVVMSGGGEMISVGEVFSLAKKLGAAATLEKPFSEADMLSAINAALGAGGTNDASDHE